MPSVLNLELEKKCAECEYCVPQNNKFYCVIRSEYTQMNNCCDDYDYTEIDFYYGA